VTENQFPREKEKTRLRRKNYGKKFLRLFCQEADWRVFSFTSLLNGKNLSREQEKRFFG
jgi:hypothetical protein